MIMCLGSGVFAGDEGNSSNQIVVKDALTGKETISTVPSSGITELPEYNPFPAPFSIIGTDGRTEMSPYEKRIVYVESRFLNDPYVHLGTGFMVGNDLVATAGPNIFEGGKWANSVTVTSKTSYTNTIATANLSKLIVSTEWINDSDNDYDYGLIKLSSQLGTSTGYFGLRINNDISLTNTFANITGYPAGDSIYKRRQMTMNGNILEDTGLSLYYDVDTMGGQSGSPIRRLDGYVVGIHCFENINPMHYGNHGVKFSREIGDIINDYR